MSFKEILGITVPAITAIVASFATATEAASLRSLGTYNPGLGEGASEIAAYDAVTQRLFVTNAQSNTIDILNISNPAVPSLFRQVDITPFGSDLNYLSFKNGLLAAALDGSSRQGPGSVTFFNAKGDFLQQLAVGPRPDMLAFTPDGSKLVVANEGTPSDDYTVDPEGSISIVDVQNASVVTADFQKFNTEPLDSSIRIFGSRASVAQDLEPENVAISPDGKIAYVSLQENNGIATVDIDAAEVVSLFGAGFKDFSEAGSGLDPSDRDDAINIRTYNNLFGLYQPDAIATYEANGETYIVTANEGDARVYPEDDTETLEEGDAFNEEVRVKDLALDPQAFPDGTGDDEKLGRLKVTTTLGDANNDGLYEALYAFGGRSFSIYDSRGNQVFDSGDDFEQILAQQAPDLFNVDIDAEDGVETEREVDGRSDDKGPEPEGLSVGKIGDRTFAFISLERSNGIFTYDITVPTQTNFVSFTPVAPGDISPEGNLFISSEDSPTGQPLVVLSNETSGTTTLYGITGLGPDSPSATEVPEPLSNAGLLGLMAIGGIQLMRRYWRLR